MKRYSIDWVYKKESENGTFADYSEADGLIKDLYETIDNNAKKIIKLTEQNKEMLEMLKITRKHNFLGGWCVVEPKVRNLIEKIEGEQNG